jgi:hypothetical protein
VRCEACNCSFAAGTKQCVHCGNRLGGPLDLTVLRGAGRTDGEGGEAEPAGPTSIGKLVVWALSAGIAMLAHMLNTCADR